jgi:NAD(P)-dependent dehydrogenase (short-subunit alcohol dehydrogenase family)
MIAGPSFSVEKDSQMTKPVAVVAGVGAEFGLGAAICRRFATEGYHVLVAGRTQAKIDQVEVAIRARGGSADAVVTDATQERDVIQLFDQAMEPGDGLAPADVVVFNAGNNSQKDFLEIEASLFEQFLRDGCFAGFLVGREAARRFMKGKRAGTIIFTGASASLRGKPGYSQFAAAKAGLRMIAQSMAREFSPQGIHVAHVVIDGGIDGEQLRSRFPNAIAAKGVGGLLSIDAIAETYWQLHRQPRSAWTHEIDLRPFKEPF